MIKYAILFTKDNAAEIAAQVHFYTAEEIMTDYGYMLGNESGTAALFMDKLSSGELVLGGVISMSYFKANHPDVQINDKTFTEYHRF